jgi:ABC-2 type transport system ATP-binding protein
MSTVERVDEAVRLTGASVYGVQFPDLIVRSGEVVVLSGPNGSGKTTVSRVLVGELAADGTARVLGESLFTADVKRRIGFLVKDLETMGSLTSRDVLDICAAVRDCGTAYAHELAARLGLDLDRPMARLSGGQLRRLGIVQALMHEPELIVLDDPATELDDEARRVLPALLRAAAARGAAVVVTAQTDSDAETFADRVVPLRRDEAAGQGPDLVTASVARAPETRDAEPTAAIRTPRADSRADSWADSRADRRARQTARGAVDDAGRAGCTRRPPRQPVGVDRRPARRIDVRRSKPSLVPAGPALPRAG